MGMEILALIGLREAVIIYLIILALFLISMLFAKPTEKAQKSSPVILVIFILISVLFVSYLLLNLLNII